MKYNDINQIPRFTRVPNYQCDVSWSFIEEWVNNNKPDFEPDFQRGHVWSRDQQIAFVEFCLRGGTSGRNLYLNSKDYMRGTGADLVLVDGKQRLTAVLYWLRNSFPVFGDTWRSNLNRLHFGDQNTSFRVHINNLQTKAEVLQWYLEMNSGGTIHTKEELEKVKILLEKEALTNP